jgi:predicted nucleotidyltransferase component of viral defense system
MTFDLDFLGNNISNSCSRIKEIFIDIIENSNSDDCVEYDLSTLKVSVINLKKTYTGVRVSSVSLLKRSIEKLIIGISFGDIIVPNADERILINNIIGTNEALVTTYSIQSVIAEKLEALVSLGEDNYRIKDYYDLYILLNTYVLDENILYDAIFSTFKNRGTRLNMSILDREDFIYGESINLRWSNMLKKLSVKDDVSFIDCVKVIKEKINPIINNLS